MILVTTGTNGEPFDRLLRPFLDFHLDEELVVQHGPSTIRPPGATCVSTVAFAEFTELVQRSRVVITHAGVGSVLVALAAGRRPLVVPRLARFGEAVDDHQLAFARKLDSAELVTLIEPAELGDGLRDTLAAPDLYAHFPRDPLVGELRRYLRDVIRPGEGKSA